MDTWFLSHPIYRSLIMSSVGLASWLLPMSTKDIPKLIRLASYPTAICCLVAAIQNSFAWEEIENRLVKEKLIANELEDLELGLEAEAMALRMREFIISRQEEAIEVEIEEPEPTLLPPQPARQIEAETPLRKIQRSAGQAGIDLYVYLKGKGASLADQDGWVNLRQLQRNWGRLDSKALTQLVELLSSVELGQCRVSGKTRQFRFTA